MKLHSFYRKFDAINKEERFRAIEIPGEPTSLFVIFQQLTAVRAQKKYFEEREERLLRLAETGFEQLTKKKDGE